MDNAKQGQQGQGCTKCFGPSHGSNEHHNHQDDFFDFRTWSPSKLCMHMGHGWGSGMIG